MRILLVDDEPALLASVARSLRYEGYQVTTVGDGLAALARVAQDRPDAVILDVMMPRISGLEVCRRLRSAGDRTPILMLTARDAIADRVEGLDAGADDYLVKPFAYEELQARLRAILRRQAPASPDGDQSAVLTVADVSLDPNTWQASRRGRELTLTQTEFALLETLLRHPGQVLTRGQLYENVWGANLNGMTNSLDVYIGYLRRKLEAAGEERLIHTVRGVGFVLRPPKPMP